MATTTPQRPPDLDERTGGEPQALIEEARQRALRRRRRNLAGALAAALGGLWLYSIAGARDAPTSASTSSPATAAFGHPRAALPEELSYTADGGVTLVHRDGTQKRLVKAVDTRLPDGSAHRTQAYYGIEWSPDGSKLLSLRLSATPGLVVVDETGKLGSRLESSTSVAHWSPDGSRIAWVTGERGGYAILVASSDGRKVRRVATLPRRPPQLRGSAFSWSPDGTRIVYAGRHDSGLFVVDADGRSAPRSILRAGVGEAHWSPDGSLIAYTSGDALRVVRPDGTGSHIVVAHGTGAAWSPDGTQLSFVGKGARGFATISIVRADGSGLRRLVRCGCTLRGPGFAPSLTWSSDGTRIAYVSGKGNTVSTIRPDGSGATRVARVTARGPQCCAYPWWPLWRPARPA